MRLSDKEKIEIEYWRQSQFEAPTEFTKANLLNKMQEARQFNYKCQKFKSILSDRQKVLEIGAGQGWASCFMKKYYLPKAHFSVSDISPYAIESLPYWEKVYDVKIDHHFAAKSYAIDVDEKYDLIFCYAAAHHFVLIEETLNNLGNLLHSDGVILFLYEPVSSKLLYPLHKAYVDRMPHVTPEDVLVPSKIKEAAKRCDLQCHVHYDAHQVVMRGVGSSLYFNLLQTVPFLKYWLPGSADFEFRLST